MQRPLSALHILLPAMFAVALGCASHARADHDWIVDKPGHERRFTDLSFGLSMGGARGFLVAPGVLLGIPVVDDGFISAVNDAFFLEPGLFLGVRHRHDDNDLWVIPEFGPRWNFYLTPDWDVFAALKLGWAIGEHGDLWVRGTVGMQWWFRRPFALRLETNAHRLGPGVFGGLSYAFL